MLIRKFSHFLRTNVSAIYFLIGPKKVLPSIEQNKYIAVPQTAESTKVMNIGSYLTHAAPYVPPPPKYVKEAMLKLEQYLSPGKNSP